MLRAVGAGGTAAGKEEAATSETEVVGGGHMTEETEKETEKETETGTEMTADTATGAAPTGMITEIRAGAGMLLMLLSLLQGV